MPINAFKHLNCAKYSGGIFGGGGGGGGLGTYLKLVLHLEHFLQKNCNLRELTRGRGVYN